MKCVVFVVKCVVCDVVKVMCVEVCEDVGDVGEMWDEGWMCEDVWCGGVWDEVEDLAFVEGLRARGTSAARDAATSDEERWEVIVMYVDGWDVMECC